MGGQLPAGRRVGSRVRGPSRARSSAARFPARSEPSRRKVAHARLAHLQEDVRHPMKVHKRVRLPWGPQGMQCKWWRGALQTASTGGGPSGVSGAAAGATAGSCLQTCSPLPGRVACAAQQPAGMAAALRGRLPQAVQGRASGSFIRL